MTVCRDFSITDVLVVKRAFPDWVKSLWFQTLNEGSSITFIEWWERSREILEDWRCIFADLQESCCENGLRLKVLGFEDLEKSQSRFIFELEEYFGARVEISNKGESTAKVNAGLYGVNAIRAYLLLNRLNKPFSRSSIIRSVQNRLRLSPRNLVQGGAIGRLLNTSSSRRISLPDDLQYLDWV